MSSGIGIVFDRDVPQGFGRVVLDEIFPSEYAAKAGMILKLLDLLQQHKLLPDQEEETKMRLCLDEALVNAVKHGNKFDAAKKVHVGMYVDGRRWGLRVEDEGAGFDPATIPNPDDPESLLAWLDSARPVAPVAEAALLLHGRHTWGDPWYEHACYSRYGAIPSA